VSRVACVYLPQWSINLLQRRLRRRAVGGDTPRELSPLPPLLLVATVGPRRLVMRACARSIHQGVRVGMTLAHARAILPARPSPLIKPYSPERDRIALVALACWANRFTPMVAADPPDGLVLDIAGCERLFHGEGGLVAQLAASLASFKLDARIAVAPTLGCGWAVSRYGGGAVTAIAPAEIRAALAALPVAALRLDTAMVAALAEVGVTQVQHLLDIPRKELVGRFGAGMLLRIDQAMGLAWEPLDPVVPPAPLVVEREFEGPTTDGEPIRQATQGLIAGLIRSLHEQNHGVLQLRLTLRRPNTTPLSLEAHLSRPCRDAKHLWSVLAPRLESAQLAYGVDHLTLAAARSGVLPHEQLHTPHAPGSVHDAALEVEAARAIDMLASRLGHACVMRCRLIDTHLPEKAAHYSEALAAPVGETTTPVKQAAPPPVALSPRPSLLFSPPQPIHVMSVTPDGPPLQIRWRNETLVIQQWVGPERVALEWWQGACDDSAAGAASARGAPTRDYFQVQDPLGRWLWLFRHWPSRRWFIHGQWA